MIQLALAAPAQWSHNLLAFGTTLVGLGQSRGADSRARVLPGPTTEAPATPRRLDTSCRILLEKWTGASSAKVTGLVSN